jgi:hypothetical protein
VRTVLTPLISHVREFPATVHGLIDTENPVSPAVAKSAEQWGNDYATARDLVRRLTPPAGPRGQQAARLYETGAMLYVESARTASAAALAAPSGARTSMAAKSERLYVLGDRMFDSAFRLLNIDGALTPSVLRFPAAVPGDSNAPVSVGPPASSSLGVPVPTAAWLESHSTDLAQLADLVRSMSGKRSALQAGQRLIAAPISDAPAQEAVTSLRLAALVKGEMESASGESAVPGQAERLSLMADRVWNSALAVLGSSSGVDEDPLAIPAAPSDDVLYTGGVFDGRPPPLNPGDPVDKGLPGGLPTLDPMSLIGR